MTNPFIIVAGDWRDTSDTTKFENMISAINTSGAKGFIFVGDGSGCAKGYDINSVMNKITIPKYPIPGNHEDDPNCTTGISSGVAGRYYSDFAGLGVQAEFAGGNDGCFQKNFNQIKTGNGESPCIIVRHAEWFNCSGCKHGTTSINLPSNTVLACCGHSHCATLTTNSAGNCLWINETSPTGSPASRGCGDLDKFSYVEFDKSVSGKLTVRAARISSQIKVTRPTTWGKSVTIPYNVNPVNDYGCVASVCTKGAGALPEGCNNTCDVTPPPPVEIDIKLMIVIAVAIVLLMYFAYSIFMS